MRRRIECPLRQIMPLPHAVRMDSERQPIDLIVDRYLPNANEATRAKAREDLTAFVQALLRIATRRALEERAAGDSRESSGRLRIPPAP